MKKITIYIVGAILCLKKRKDQSLKRKAFMLICTVLLCIISPTVAQQRKAVEGTANGIQIGQKLPDSIWQHSFAFINDPSGKTNISLQEYKGKLIILDFWASWCGSCLAKFTALDSLQAKFKDKLVILLVSSVNTKDKLERMQKVLRGKAAETKPTQMGSIINDKMLMALFPHQYLPHYVWIGAKGEVKAITPAEFVNEVNIKQMLPLSILKKP